MKILITGSSGHWGEALARVLGSMGHRVMGIDIKPSECTNRLGCITNRSFVKGCMKGMDVVLHTASLHKPHVVTHSNQDFMDTNLTGTLNLLEEAKSNKIKSFIYTSTTSTFGDVLTSNINEPAIWVDEEIQPLPKNIYGVTKIAAEDLCQLFYRNHKLPCLILKTSRFFPEEDDRKEVRQLYEDANIKANELLYRRVDIEDTVTAHLIAMEKAHEIGFGKYIISAISPFTKNDLVDLNSDAISVVEKIYPDYKELYRIKGWQMFPKIDRVYVNKKARRELGWQPKYDFEHVLNCLKAGSDYQSPLSIDIGVKRYHAQKFKDGPYPVADH